VRCTQTGERVRGALVRITTQSERTRQFQATTRSARAKWVRAKVNTSPQKETSESERWKEARARFFLLLMKRVFFVVPCLPSIQAGGRTGLILI